MIVADHTHKGRGRQELPPENYHVPLIIQAPAHIARGRVDGLASRIDVSPTVPGLLNLNCRSKLFGHDIRRQGMHHGPALMADHQAVG